MQHPDPPLPRPPPQGKLTTLIALYDDADAAAQKRAEGSEDDAGPEKKSKQAEGLGKAHGSKRRISAQANVEPGAAFHFLVLRVGGPESVCGSCLVELRECALNPKP